MIKIALESLATSNCYARTNFKQNFLHIQLIKKQMNFKSYIHFTSALIQAGPPNRFATQSLYIDCGTLLLSNGSPQPGTVWSQSQHFNANATQIQK